LRQAVQLGYDDARLPPLLSAACLTTGDKHETADRAIARLEHALSVAGPQPEVVRRLSRAYRRQNRLADARQVLDRAPAENLSLALERGLLLLAESQLVPAEKAFAEAARYDPRSPAPCLNLVFARLSLGRLAEALELLPRAIELAPLPGQQRLLAQLRVLAARRPEALAGWSPEDDKAVVQCLRTIGRTESVGPLFEALAAARPLSPVVKDAQTELVPLLAKDRIDRGDAEGARQLLEPQLGSKSATLVHNLLGICACLRQDFTTAVRHFRLALPSVGDDARVQQNLAIVRGWMGEGERAVAHWRRFAELHVKQPAGAADYHQRIGALVRERLNENMQATV
jgi:Flp pilus assembly protein TadD